MASVVLNPRESGKYIASLSKEVKINPDGIKKTARVIADAVKSGQLDMEAFKQVRRGRKIDHIIRQCLPGK